jgi:hypothetical protein
MWDTDDCRDLLILHGVQRLWAGVFLGGLGSMVEGHGSPAAGAVQPCCVHCPHPTAAPVCVGLLCVHVACIVACNESRHTCACTWLYMLTRLCLDVEGDPKGPCCGPPPRAITCTRVHVAVHLHCRCLLCRCTSTVCLLLRLMCVAATLGVGSRWGSKCTWFNKPLVMGAQPTAAPGPPLAVAHAVVSWSCEPIPPQL